MAGSRRTRRIVGCWLAWAALACARPAWGLIDPERPASWLIGECKAIAALKVSAVGKGSATFVVTEVLRGKLTAGAVTIRWTATQRPPVPAGMVGQAAVLLVPKDDEDPTLLQVSPEFLSLKPDPTRPGEYEFLRLNGFVKGSFNGEAGDFVRLIEDTLAGRAYFPIWADTSFASARKIGELPGAAAGLAVGDLDGDGGLDVLAATSQGVIALSPDGQGRFAAHAVEGVGPAALLDVADADGDGRCDILTGAGVFLNQGRRRFAPARGLAGRAWSDARFCYVPGRAAPAVAAIETGRMRLLAPGRDGAWTDITERTGLDKAPGGVVCFSVGEVAGRAEAVVVTRDAMVRLEGPANRPLRQVQSLPLVEPGAGAVRHARLCRRDLNGDGLDDLFLTRDGQARFYRRQADGALAEVPDHLGDVRKMFQPVTGLTGLLCEDWNNDGLADLLAWSGSPGLLLVMNRGYHNLREATALFDLPNALRNLRPPHAVGTADVDGDGDLDLLVAAGRGLHLLSNTFEKKPEEANDRPRNPLLTVRAVGRFGALVAVEDKDRRRLAGRRIGAGPVAGTLHFGYRDAAPAAVSLQTIDGKTLRQGLPPGAAGKPVTFRQ